MHGLIAAVEAFIGRKTPGDFVPQPTDLGFPYSSEVLRQRDTAIAHRAAECVVRDLSACTFRPDTTARRTVRDKLRPWVTQLITNAIMEGNMPPKYDPWDAA